MLREYTLIWNYFNKFKTTGIRCCWWYLDILFWFKYISIWYTPHTIRRIAPYLVHWKLSNFHRQWILMQMWMQNHFYIHMKIEFFPKREEENKNKEISMSMYECVMYDEYGFEWIRSIHFCCCCCCWQFARQHK